MHKSRIKSLKELTSAVLSKMEKAHYSPVPVLRMGLEDVFGQSGSPNELLAYYGLTVEKIMEKTRFLLKKK